MPTKFFDLHPLEDVILPTHKPDDFDDIGNWQAHGRTVYQTHPGERQMEGSGASLPDRRFRMMRT